MERSFRPGDLVQLVSGGPIMTVEGYQDGGTNDRVMKCVWFVNREAKRGTFAEPLLKRYDPNRTARL
jgi:uncharacterized protein YodC (DUF2158 family)